MSDTSNWDDIGIVKDPEPNPQHAAPPPFTLTPRAARAESVASPYAEAAEKMMSYPRDTLACLLGLLQPPTWMRGLWGEVKGGWTNRRASDALLSYADAQALIDARITELGLDAAKVNAYPKSHCSLAEDRNFWNLTFNDRLEMFK